jgi:hypothetical protein
MFVTTTGPVTVGAAIPWMLTPSTSALNPKLFGAESRVTVPGTRLVVCISLVDRHRLDLRQRRSGEQGAKHDRRKRHPPSFHFHSSPVPQRQKRSA